MFAAPFIPQQQCFNTLNSPHPPQHLFFYHFDKTHLHGKEMVPHCTFNYYFLEGRWTIIEMLLKQLYKIK